LWPDEKYYLTSTQKGVNFVYKRAEVMYTSRKEVRIKAGGLQLIRKFWSPIIGREKSEQMILRKGGLKVKSKNLTVAVLTTLIAAIVPQNRGKASATAESRGRALNDGLERDLGVGIAWIFQGFYILTSSKEKGVLRECG
jgi:hypothetical protein